MSMKEQGHEPFFGMETADDAPFARTDDVITAQVDARDYLDAKTEAMRAHATQIEVDGPFFALSNHIGQKAFGLEHYVLLAGERGPREIEPQGWEADLFAGL